jgi:uncharacterized protein
VNPVQPIKHLSWLLTNLIERVPAIAHAIVVSSDGLPLACSQDFPTDRADQLSAITSGLISLTQGASRMFEGGAVTQTVVEMQRGLLIVVSIGDGSTLTVLAATDSDMGLVAYEMTMLADRAGRALTPKMRGAL